MINPTCVLLAYRPKLVTSQCLTNLVVVNSINLLTK